MSVEHEDQAVLWPCLGLSQMDRLLEIGIALSAEKVPHRLFKTILDAAMDITACDAGTLYVLRGDALHFQMMITKSLHYSKGVEGEPVDMPAVPLVPTHVCARCALEKQRINVANVYEAVGTYDFSGPLDYDRITGYRTGSMLVVPMLDDYGHVIGVLQLINAQNLAGETIPFDRRFEPVVSALASQAAIRLTTMRYSTELTETLDSFVQVMSTAIDARSPYNANHTENMVKYAQRFMAWLNQTGNPWLSDEGDQRRLIMCVWLHDVGKLVIPLEIMDKRTRLGVMGQTVRHRLEIAALTTRLAYLEGLISEACYASQSAQWAYAETVIHMADTADRVDDALASALSEVHTYRYLDGEGHSHGLLTDEEYEALQIRRGTLTPAERESIENHVVMTMKMLGKMKFSGELKQVPFWASAHHEMLDGSGYPLGLQGEDIPPEVRLLTILDIYDALTAKDRPYKRAMCATEALAVLEKMVHQGRIDGSIFYMFKESHAWEGEGDENTVVYSMGSDALCASV